MKLAQWRSKLPGIGLRKVKSIIAVAIAFVIWQIVRWLVSPDLEVHPVFGYVYAVVELRETPEKTKTFSIYRLKATVIGLVLGLATLPLSVLLEKNIPLTLTPVSAGCVLYLGAICSCLAYVLYNEGLRGVSAFAAAAMLNLMPLSGTVLSALILHEAIGLRALGGGALIIAGVLICTLNKR